MEIRCIDNNDTEREFRSIVIAKKTYIYCRTEESFQRADIMFSLLGTCKVLGKDSEKWHIHPHAHRVNIYLNCMRRI